MNLKSILAGTAICWPLALSAQTATSSDATSSGSKVGTGAVIEVPAEIVPSIESGEPVPGGTTTPTPGIPAATPMSPVDSGASSGSISQPTAPGEGLTTGGAGTGR